MRASDQFGDRLRQAISDMGHTQRSVAPRLGVSESVVSNWVRMRNEPSLDDLAKIALKLNVSADWLLGLSERRALDTTVTPEPLDVGLPPRAVREIEAIAREIQGIAAQAEEAVARLQKKLPPSR